MKAFISVDMEGMPYIVSVEHLLPKKSLYDEARKIMTRVTRVVCEELYSNGFKDIIVADSHAMMINLLVDELPDYVSIIRGAPRVLSMVSLINECDVALFLGYHAKYGTARAVLDHTYSGSTIRRIEINGVEVSECLFNAYIAGHYNVPVILVAGDERLIEDDVKKYLPWAEYVVLKKSLGRYAALSKSFKVLEEELRVKVRRACEKFSKGEVKPLKTKYPVHVRMELISSIYAEFAELIPGIRRINGLTIEFEAKDVVEAFKIMQVIILLGVGIRAVTSSVS